VASRHSGNAIVLPALFSKSGGPVPVPYGSPPVRFWTGGGRFVRAGCSGLHSLQADPTAAGREGPAGSPGSPLARSAAPVYSFSPLGAPHLPKTRPPRSRRWATRRRALPPRGATAGRTARRPATPAHGGCQTETRPHEAPVSKAVALTVGGDWAASRLHGAGRIGMAGRGFCRRSAGRSPGRFDGCAPGPLPVVRSAARPSMPARGRAAPD
jgi:hypothetical protein